MIKGLVYLTGLVTLTLVAAAAAVAYKVHTWPWGDYIRESREVVARKLDPCESGPERRDRRDDAGRRDSGDAITTTSRDVQGARDGDSLPQRRPNRPADPVRPVRDYFPANSRHAVRRGDTLYALARRYYGDAERWREIARANDIRRPSDLRVGRLIVVPLAALVTTRAATAGEERNWLPDLRLMLSPAVEIEDAPGRDTENGIQQGCTRD